MSSTRKVLRIFLASPGDLQDERRIIGKVVDEFNDSWADTLGYQIELMGWEDTIASYGRPQHIINQEVDRCDLFIGMIWRRWGTPPDSEGRFTSGFEEEFQRAIDRRERDGSPEISLFFKQISDDFMVDPGEDLKKVVQFREKMIREKKILFQDFPDVQKMEVLSRRRITAYVQQVRVMDESGEPNEAGTKPADSNSDKANDKTRNAESSPLSAEGFAFLESLVDRISREEAMKDLSAFDIARFRLLANSLSKPGNEEMDLGVHDINILFSARAEGKKLGRREISCLARLGLQYIGDGNVPLWSWYSDLMDSGLDVALLSSWLGVDDDEKVGAIRVLGALARKLPTNDEPIKRERFLDTWFSEDSSARLRSAALEYLAKNGTAEDYQVAEKEYDRSDRGTSHEALECMIDILLRTGQGTSPQQLVLESQFESLNSDTLQAVLKGFDNLENETLLLGLEHRNVQVRLQTLKILLERDVLTHEMAERLSKDSDALVRNEAITVLVKLGRSLAEEEIEKILARPDGSDSKGKAIFERYKVEVLKKRPEPGLTKEIEVSLMYNDPPYFARAERYFAKYTEELRRDIDDCFKGYYEERVRRTQAILGDQATGLLLPVNDLEDFYRKRLTRQGLDILCRAGNRQDLQRVRGNLQSGYAGTSKGDVEYLRKHGEWEDISLLARADPLYLRDSLLGGYENFHDQVARAILAMSRGHSIAILLVLDMPATILKKTIELCAESRFSNISDDALLGLLDHELADVRKAASIKAVRAFSARRIKSILDGYIGRDKYRYYNVIHWLDLGASMPRDEARRVARTVAG